MPIGPNAFNRHHVAGKGDEESALDATIEGIANLLGTIGISTKLAQMGIEAKDLPWIAEQALAASRLIKNNPRPVDRAGMDRLLAAAFLGDRQSLSSPLQPDARAS
ncbi:MAG TPA: iron-containing alcohol dehydrogenase [Devosia sp.]|nr:iron-containing alcohol dehydrogenase [Devosia sp.]